MEELVVHCYGYDSLSQIPGSSRHYKVCLLFLSHHPHWWHGASGCHTWSWWSGEEDGHHSSWCSWPSVINAGPFLLIPPLSSLGCPFSCLGHHDLWPCGFHFLHFMDRFIIPESLAELIQESPTTAPLLLLCLCPAALSQGSLFAETSSEVNAAFLIALGVLTMTLLHLLSYVLQIMLN